jgi:hypothetical protein
MIALTDGMIRQQDIRRPLGLPRKIPAERMVPALVLGGRRGIVSELSGPGCDVLARRVDG